MESMPPVTMAAPGRILGKGERPPECCTGFRAVGTGDEVSQLELEPAH
jgi:hypothetical protein